LLPYKIYTQDIAESNSKGMTLFELEKSIFTASMGTLSNDNLHIICRISVNLTYIGAKIRRSEKEP
jgi:hypothetical protein